MKPPHDFLRVCKRLGIVPTRFVLVVSVANQAVSLFEKSSLRSGGRQTAGIFRLSAESRYEKISIRQKFSLFHFPLWHQPGRRLERHAARIASRRGKNRRWLAGGDGFQGPPAHRLHLAGDAGCQNHHAHSLAGRTRTWPQPQWQRGFPRPLHLHSWHRRPDDDWQTHVVRLHPSGRRRFDSALRQTARRHAGLDWRTLR